MNVGRIGYLNVLPIYRPLEDGTVENDFEFVSGPPSHLNDLMRQGLLPVSAASSLEYASRPERYLLVPDLAIGSCGPVRSVLLLSDRPVSELHDETVLVSSQTHTSAALFRVLMNKRYAIKPRLIVGSAQKTLALGEHPTAILAIGDQALKLAGHPDYPEILDLGQAWQEWTGLPFIFGVWLAAREAFQADPQGVRQACRTLLTAKREGVARISEMSRLAAEETGMSLERAETYFAGLCYDLGEREQMGLTRFMECLAETGAIPARARFGIPGFGRRIDAKKAGPEGPASISTSRDNYLASAFLGAAFLGAAFLGAAFLAAAFLGAAFLSASFLGAAFLAAAFLGAAFLGLSSDLSAALSSAFSSLAAALTGAFLASFLASFLGAGSSEAARRVSSMMTMGAASPRRAWDSLTMRVYPPPPSE